MRKHGSPEVLESIRFRAVELSEQGYGKAEIAKILDRAPSTVDKWLKIADEQGIDALRAKPHAGATPKLTTEQKEDLQQRLCDGALAAGFETDLWTCPRIRELILRVYGVEYHVDYLGPFLKSLGFSWQKPQRRAAERDEEKVVRWVKKDWPRIKKRPGVLTQPSCLSTKVAFN